jgi:hypothetical protein
VSCEPECERPASNPDAWICQKCGRLNDVGPSTGSGGQAFIAGVAVPVGDWRIDAVSRKYDPKHSDPAPGGDEPDEPHVVGG